MVKENLFDRALRLRDEDQHALRLLINTRRGVSGAKDAYEAWLLDMSQNHPYDLQTIMLHVEANVTKLGQLRESINDGVEPNDADKSFLIQMLEITGQLDDIQ